MANYYSDHPEIAFHLNHPLMKRVVDLKERNYIDKDNFSDAPVNYEDAIENYKRLLDIAGDVAANIIEPNSEAVDLEGPHLENGRMIYASKTFENLDATRKAGLWGISMPRLTVGSIFPTPCSPWHRKLSLQPTLVSRTYGLSRVVSTRSTSSVLKSNARNTFPASVLARPCQWT